MDKKVIGQRISELRKEKGLTQKELADKLCVTDKTISKWETGVNFPDIAIMERLAEVLETSVSDLLGLEQATSEMVIKGMTEISVEEKDEIKKTMKKRAWITIFLGVILAVTEVYISWKLHLIRIEGGVYGVCTTGMIGTIGVIIGNAVYSLINVKKL